MADERTSYHRLSYTLWFTDGDDRTLTIDNPRENLTASDFTTLNNLAKDVFLGDKNLATCKGVKTAKYTDGTVTKLQVTPE